MIAWPNQMRVGEAGLVTIRVTGAAPVRILDLDLLGDGQPGQRIYADDLRDVAALYLRPRVAGRFQLQLQAFDADGCGDTTGVAREVRVQ